MKITGNSESSMTQLATKSGKLDAILTGEQVDQIELFCKLLFDWNEQMNLVGNATQEVLLQDHILDSLSLVPSITAEKLTLIDIGSGAGFPGLILALALPNLQVTLVEATGKKARFLENAAVQLRLKDRLTILNGRAEALAHAALLRHQYDIATCRAVGELDLVLELTLPFLKLGGRALIQRSISQYQQEELPARQNVVKLGGKLKETLFPDKTVLGKDRAILVFEQISAAPAQYPRPWHKLKKRDS